MQRALGLMHQEIVQPSDTHWTCNSRSVFAEKMQCTAIMRCLKALSEKGEQCLWKHHMTGVSFIACLIIFQCFMKIVHFAHKGLQGVNIMLAKASSIIEKVYFEKCRSEESWNEMWKEIIEFCQDYKIAVPDEETLRSSKRRVLAKASAARMHLNVPITLGQKNM